MTLSASCNPFDLLARLAMALLATGLLAIPASAGERDNGALNARALVVLERQFTEFRDAAGALASDSEAFCAGQAGREEASAALRSTWLAWAPLDAYQFGPTEREGAVLRVDFWPDSKDYVGRGLRALLALPEESLSDGAIVAQASAAAQGLPAYERLILGDEDADGEACPAIIGISANLANLAQDLLEGWFAPGGWADTMRTPGLDNPVYLDASEVTKAFYTAIDFELTRIAGARLARPLGSFEAPRPERAEAWRAGLSLAIIDAQLAGIGALLDEGFASAIPEPERLRVMDVIADTRARLARIGAPLHEAVADPALRIRVEGLHTRVLYLQRLFSEEIGPALGVDTGFTAADGD